MAFSRDRWARQAPESCLREAHGGGTCGRRPRGRFDRQPPHRPRGAAQLHPDPGVFEMAMRVADASAQRCVVIGNREENDIEPALALGMKAILVHPDDPKPLSSRAHAVAPDLWECASVLKAMLGA